MKYFILLLIPVLLLIGCKGCDITAQTKPPMQLHLTWQDSNPVGVIKTFVIYRWGGSDTTIYTRVDSFQVISAATILDYNIPIQVTWDWFKYGVKAVALDGKSEVALTRFYSYAQFSPLIPMNLKIIK